MRIRREYDGNRFSNEANFVDGEDRLVVKGGAIVRVGDHRANIFGGDDRMDSFEGQGGAGIDSNNAPVRNRAAANFSMEHPRQAQVVNIFRAAGDFCIAFQARERTPHFAPGRGFPFFLWRGLYRRAPGFFESRGHCYSTPVGRVREARSSARRTCTRTISRL